MKTVHRRPFASDNSSIHSASFRLEVEWQQVLVPILTQNHHFYSVLEVAWRPKVTLQSWSDQSPARHEGVDLKERVVRGQWQTKHSQVSMSDRSEPCKLWGCRPEAHFVK